MKSFFIEVARRPTTGVWKKFYIPTSSYHHGVFAVQQSLERMYEKEEYVKVEVCHKAFRNGEENPQFQADVKDEYGHRVVDFTVARQDSESFRFRVLRPSADPFTIDGIVTGLVLTAQLDVAQEVAERVEMPMLIIDTEGKLSDIYVNRGISNHESS